MESLWWDEFLAYLKHISENNSKNVPLDRGITLILRYFGIIKDVKIIKTEEDAKALTGLAGNLSFTTKEKEAWLKAGMPELTKFLEGYRNGHNSRNT